MWTERALNPNADLGRGPDAVWGTAWQGLCGRVEDDFCVTVRRERARTTWDGEGERFGGWEFVCPGLAGGETFDEVDGPRAETRTCGRRVDKLYVPVGGMRWSAWKGIGQQGTGPHFHMGRLAPGHIRTVSHGHMDTSEGASGESEGVRGLRVPRMRAACARCHGVVNGTVYGAKGWNRFVAVVTGGLLYGREVERPRGFVYTRQRRKKRRANDAAPQRERVCGLFLEGLSDRGIAARLGIGAGTVRNHITRLYRRHGVRGRAALGAKLGVEVASGTARGDPSTMEGSGGYRLPRRKAEILGLMRKGKSAGEIARELGVGLKTVYRQQARLYVLYRVHSGGELVAKVAALRRARVRGVLEGNRAPALDGCSAPSAHGRIVTSELDVSCAATPGR